MWPQKCLNKFALLFLSVIFAGIIGTGVDCCAVEFPKKFILLGDKKIQVEIADTYERQEQGLMFRKTLEANEGMLFIFPQKQVLSFWMKNTLIDLTIGYFDESGKLFQTLDMSAQFIKSEHRPKTYISSKPAKYALEMNRGWFKKNKIKLGTQIKVL